MADRAIRYLMRADQRRGRRAQLAAGRYHRRRRLLLDRGRVFMLLAAVTLVHLLTTGAAAVRCTQVGLHVLVAFLLWLLGAAFAMLSLVAGQFPVLAAAAVAVARTLRGWLLGGL